MSDNNESTGGGIGICTILFIVFLVLKLCKVGAVATWSWWAVTSPLWGPAVLVAAIFGVCLLLAAVSKK